MVRASYTGTIGVDPKRTPLLYAFADDRMENRSEALVYDLAGKKQVFIPATLVAYRPGW